MRKPRLNPGVSPRSMRSCFSQLEMLACVMPNVSASCAILVAERASCTTCLRTSVGYVTLTRISALLVSWYQRHSPGLRRRSCPQAARRPETRSVIRAAGGSGLSLSVYSPEAFRIDIWGGGRPSLSRIPQRLLPGIRVACLAGSRSGPCAGI
jgi:hypothetical protein